MEQLFIDELKSQIEMSDFSARSFSKAIGRDASRVSQIYNKTLKTIKYDEARRMFLLLGFIEEKYLNDYLNLIGVKIPTNILNDGLTYDTVGDLRDCYKESNNCAINKRDVVKNIITNGKQMSLIIPEYIIDKLYTLSEEEFRTPEQQATKILVDYLKESKVDVTTRNL